MVKQFISKKELRQMLDVLGGPITRRSIELLESMPTQQVGVHTQASITTARTFAIKYGEAARKGHVVNGLDAFVRALEVQKDEPAHMLIVNDPRGSEFVMVLLADHMSAAQAVMHVIPTKPTVTGASS